MSADAPELLFSAFCHALRTDRASVSSAQAERALGNPGLRPQWEKVCGKGCLCAEPSGVSHTGLTCPSASVQSEPCCSKSGPRPAIPASPG